MRPIRWTEAGESLLEIIIAIVVIGIVFSAYFAAYSTAASSSTTHRSAVQADAILRDSAEATKSAVREQCADASASKPGATYTVTMPTVPPGWSPVSMSSSPPGQNCPAVPTGSTCPPTTAADASGAAIPCVQRVTFSVTAPGAAARTLTIEVRTP